MNNEEKLREEFYKKFEKAIIAYKYADTEEMTDELDNIMKFSADFFHTKIADRDTELVKALEGMKPPILTECRYHNTYNDGKRDALDDALALITPQR